MIFFYGSLHAVDDILFEERYLTQLQKISRSRAHLKSNP